MHDLLKLELENWSLENRFFFLVVAAAATSGGGDGGDDVAGRP